MSICWGVGFRVKRMNWPEWLRYEGLSGREAKVERGEERRGQKKREEDREEKWRGERREERRGEERRDERREG